MFKTDKNKLANGVICINQNLNWILHFVKIIWVPKLLLQFSQMELWDFVWAANYAWLDSKAADRSCVDEFSTSRIDDLFLLWTFQALHRWFNRFQKIDIRQEIIFLKFCLLAGKHNYFTECMAVMHLQTHTRFKDSAYFCYCAYVLRILRYSGAY